LTIGDGKIVMANPDDTGQAELSADTDGQGFVRIDGKYLAQALKACGGMVDFSLASASSPMLFSLDGYRLVVMPMITEKAQAEAKAKAEQAKAEATTTEQADKPKGKRSRAKQPVTA
jgi:DNA polymerase-3 subunit beta